MQEINTNLNNIKSQLAQKYILDKKLQEIRTQLIIKEKELLNIEDKLEKESKDVEKLNRVSLSNIISIVIKNKDEKSKKEKEDYIMAKIKYDSCKSRVEFLREDILKTEKILSEFENKEDEYELLLQRKIALLNIYGNKKTKEEIINKEKELEIYIKEKKEIEESILTGSDLINEIESCKKILDSAKTWGTIDLFHGDILSSIAKHKKIDDAKNHFAKISNLLGRFNKELKDVNINSLNLSSTNITFDIFLDNIFTDISVNNKINQSYQDISYLERRIDKIISNLNDEKDNIDMKIVNKRKEYEKFIDEI